MDGTSSERRRRPGATTRSREAILRGALSVFARDGYSRASMDGIAAAAGVSVRTVYNHVPDKESLFHVVVEECAREVADAEVAVIDSTLAGVTDVEAGLVALGLGWTASKARFVEHFTLVRRIEVDIGHVAPRTVDVWQRSGPQRVLGALADRLAALSDRGLLRIEDPDRAAVHLSLLVSVANPSLRGVPLPDDVREATVRTGVRAFLHGHLPC